MKNRIGVHVPTIFMPKEDTDLTKWSVVACDQYTSQPEYWDEVEEFVGDSFSTYNLTLPEIYLEHEGVDDRIKIIYNTMKKYIHENILVQQKPGFIFVDRKTSHSESRKGLIIAVDLEEYDYAKGSQTLIRATEGTVIERLPPRIKVRENAYIETPHVMILIDDPGRTVIEPLSKRVDRLNKLYDFDLMMGGGHIKGFKIDDEENITGIIEAFENLADPGAFRAKYNVGEDKGVLLFAVGDGNHSLASAKAHWENVKKSLSKEEIEDHPARYALVEIVNVHDEGLVFEPIHRVAFNVDPQGLIGELMAYLDKNDCKAELIKGTKLKNMQKDEGCQALSFIAKDSSGTVYIKNPKHTLEVGTLQAFLDEYLKNNSQARIDYIHGGSTVDTLGTKDGNIGFYLPSIDKHDLFRTVILEGVLPRKSFSMGEADEKRYYLECRKIKK